MLEEWSNYPLRTTEGHTFFPSYEDADDMATKCGKAHPDCVFTIEPVVMLGYIITQDLKQ